MSGGRLTTIQLDSIITLHDTVLRSPPTTVHQEERHRPTGYRERERDHSHIRHLSDSFFFQTQRWLYSFCLLDYYHCVFFILLFCYITIMLEDIEGRMNLKDGSFVLLFDSAVWRVILSLDNERIQLQKNNWFSSNKRRLSPGFICLEIRAFRRRSSCRGFAEVNCSPNNVYGCFYRL